MMFADYREPLVEVASQLLVVLLDHDTMQQAASATVNGTDADLSAEVPNQYMYLLSDSLKCLPSTLSSTQYPGERDGGIGGRQLTF